jgi:hypothetical protein
MIVEGPACRFPLSGSATPFADLFKSWLAMMLFVNAANRREQKVQRNRDRTQCEVMGGGTTPPMAHKVPRSSTR